MTNLSALYPSLEKPRWIYKSAGAFLFTAYGKYDRLNRVNQYLDKLLALFRYKHQCSKIIIFNVYSKTLMDI